MTSEEVKKVTGLEDHTKLVCFENLEKRSSFIFPSKSVGRIQERLRSIYIYIAAESGKRQQVAGNLQGGGESKNVWPEATTRASLHKARVTGWFSCS